jgi:hypothetical protein
MGQLVILATRNGRTIRWKCTDIREYRSRRASFIGQGFTVS